MTERRTSVRSDVTDAAPETPSRAPLTRLGGPRLRRPQLREDVELEYEAARDAWIAAMRAAESGKAADLAALAMTQEAYESALAEKRRWDATPRVAIPIEPDRPKGIDAVVGQELARRRIQRLADEHGHQKPKGIGGLMRRLRGR